MQTMISLMDTLWAKTSISIRVIQSFCKEININHFMFTPYHRQENVVADRAVQNIKNKLKLLCEGYMEMSDTKLD